MGECLNDRRKEDLIGDAGGDIAVLLPKDWVNEVRAGNVSPWLRCSHRKGRRFRTDEDQGHVRELDNLELSATTHEECDMQEEKKESITHVIWADNVSCSRLQQKTCKTWCFIYPTPCIRNYECDGSSAVTVNKEDRRDLVIQDPEMGTI